MKRRRKQQPSLIDKSLLQIKTVPKEIITAEKVTEKLLGKKTKLTRKLSYKWMLAIKNYQQAVTRKKRADTLLEKHYKTLSKLVKKNS